MARAHDPCLSDALVARFLERTVSQPELCSIDQHVDRCSDCRALLGQLAHAIDDDELAATGLVTEPRAAPPPGLLARGTVIGRFVVIDVIGAGGMGTVYTVYDPELDRRAALKLLHHGSGERLRAEAQAMARVQHPNVVTVHDVGTYRDQVFVAMERVDGVTLRRWLARPRGWRELARVFAAAGEGLAAAHASGLVHRDFKPENVLVARDQHVKVGDFGLAGPASERVVGGTPAYMPPEAHTEQRALDARGDQY
ncbi:MAG TPA: serine/threonine-protein kinase, partial [Kofleriaceae bacterium]|nr:serine/threonine-protein kinase [Kofleriaceae bacterium]